MTKPEPDVAVVILNYNGWPWLPGCLSSLARLTTPAEVIVADNGSTDGSLERVCQDHPSVRAIRLGHNLGFAAGYNRALAEVKRPWLALLNNDATLEPDWLERLQGYARAHPRVVILGGKLLFSGVQGRVIQSAGASFTDAGTAFEIGWGQPDTGQHQAGGAVGAIPGAAMLIRRAAWLELGGFDPAYYAYLEDVDLCWRAWLGGHEVAYVPEAVARHAYGASGGGRLSPLRIRWMQRNRLANMVKHLEGSSVLGAVGVSLAYDAYRLVEYARRGQWPALRALAAGTADFWRALPGLWSQRRAVQQTRRLSDAELRARGLMVPALTAFREYRRLARASRTAAVSPAR